MDISYKDLIIFTTICEEYSFTKASEILFISQPTISKTIKKLESELNTQLLHRASRPLSITETGRIFYKRSKEMIEIFENTKLELDNYNKDLIGKISIGIPQIIGSFFFPIIAKELREKFPKVSLNVIEEGGHNVERQIEEGELSLGLCVLPTLSKNLESRLIYKDKFVICVPSQHKLARLTEIPLDALREEQFISFDKSFGLNRIINNAFKKKGFTPNIVFESSQWDLVMELVSSNLGVTIVPNILYNKFKGANIRSLDIKNTDLVWKIGVVSKPAPYLSNSEKKLIKLIEDLHKK